MKMSRPTKKQFHYQRLLLALVFAVALSSCILISIFGCEYNFRTLTLTLASQSKTSGSSNRSRGFYSKQKQQRHYHHSNYSQNSTPPVITRLPATTTTTSAALESKQGGPYHNWELFAADFEEMMQHMKIFVYADVYNNNPFANIFLPHPNPLHHLKLGNYLSEHMFKVALLGSSLLTPIPEEAHFYFLPFSINNLRNDPRVHSEESISEFVAQYTTSIGRRFRFWNASGGADHFYVYCHSVGRDAASKHPGLHNNAIQITCSSSYFQRFYVSHKDVGFPQVWPRPQQTPLNPPHARHKLVYFAGRPQNSRVRQELIRLWGNDTHMDIFYGSPSFPYEEGFKRSKYCLHVRGYEVNTARLSDAIHYGCIPVIISNYYDLPFDNVLDWSKFSVVINQGDIAFLKRRLLAITKPKYLSMYHNLGKVRRHFVWHSTARGYDCFYMTAYQLWLRRSIHRLSY